MRQWEWKRQIMSLYHKRNHFDLGDPLKGSWRWPRPRGPRFENQRNRLIFKVTSQFIVLLRWMFCSPSRTTLWDLRSQDRAPSLVEPKAKSPGRSGGAFCLATGSRTRSPESAEDAGSRNQSQTCPPRAKAGPELAAGGRASPELRAEVAAATATATARDGSPETPATYPPAAGEPAPGRRSAARYSQGAASSFSHSSAASRDQGWACAARPRAGQGGAPRTPGASSSVRASPALRRARRGFWGRRDGGFGGRRDYPSTRLRPGSCWNMRPELQVRGPAARPRRGMGDSEGATSADRARFQRKAEGGRGDRCPLCRLQSPEGGVGRRGVGRRRHLSPGTLSGLLSGRGSDAGDRNRARGAVARWLWAQQVGDSVPTGTQSAEPGPFLTWFLLVILFVSVCFTVARLCLHSWCYSANCAYLPSRSLIAQEVRRSRGMRQKVSLASGSRKTLLETRLGLQSSNQKVQSLKLHAPINHRSTKMSFNLWFIW